jgi:hypothetical protein
MSSGDQDYRTGGRMPEPDLSREAVPNADAEAPVTQIVRSAPVQDLMLTAAFDVETAKKRLKELQI